MFKAWELRGMQVLDRDGKAIGTVADTWPDDGGGEPELLLVHLGGRFKRPRFVPLAGARCEEGKLRLPWTRDGLEDGPRADDHRWGASPDLARAYWVLGTD